MLTPHRQTIDAALQAPLERRAFISRGVDLLYYAKRAADGEVIGWHTERCDCRADAVARGFVLIN
jgi:hypothetical protein